MTPKHFFLIAALMASVLGAGISGSMAQNRGTRIDITPQKIILGPRERGSEFTLLNLSEIDNTIRISVINYRQDENGVYHTLEGPLNPAFDPEEILRLSPRQFILLPNGHQKVRFSIRKPANLPDGEYRFHIMATRLMDKENLRVESGAQGVGVMTNIGAAIPVIVRHGNVSATATLSDLQYVPANAQGRPALNATIHRSGNASTIGTVKVFWIPQNGAAEEIGIASNMNLFTEIDKRFISVVLSQAPQGAGEFQMVYINDETKAPYATANLAK